MSEEAIKVEDVGKMYLISQIQHGSHSTVRDAVMNRFRSVKRRFGAVRRGTVEFGHVEPFWALKDVSFTVNRGDRIGIIGRNGAGKSTLLKLLSRITEPTTGRITITGRVASLLEVGTGFHPELSGRENIFLNGAILGMTRQEIKSKFDEIVAFAENEKFLDTPVKRYSSGMYVRLAFAVAAHLEPEILIVDEVLAVGDLEFQKKCLGKMQDVSRKEGRTVLFVSHNMAAVQALCTKGVWMQRGTVKKVGPAADVVEAYSRRGDAGDMTVNVTSKHFELVKISARSPDGSALGTFRPAQFRVTYRPRADYLDIGAELLVEDLSGSPVMGLDSRDFFNRKPIKAGQLVNVDFNIESLPLTPGPYRIQLRIKSDADNVHWEVPQQFEIDVDETVVYGTRRIDRRVHGVTAAAADVTWSVGEASDMPQLTASATN